VLAHGQVKSIDGGQANNEHYFFEAAGVGIDAALFPWVKKSKVGAGSYAQAAQLAMGYEPQRLNPACRPISAGCVEQPFRRRRFVRQRADTARRELRLKAGVIANGRITVLVLL